MSLRARLLLGLGAVAVVLVVVAGVVIRSTRTDLSTRVDEQLYATASPPVFRRGFGSEPGGTRDDESSRPSRPEAPPFAPATDDAAPSTVWIGALVEGEVRTVVPLVHDSQPSEPVWTSQATQAIEVDGLSTVAGEGEVERFRVLARQGPGDVIYLVAAPLDDVDAAVWRLVVVEVVATLAVLALLAVVALWVLRLGVRPLKDMTATAAAIGSGDLSARVPEVDPRTEAGELGAALNTMLARIETAFAASAESEERLRRFVADASHELRTPITTIRGYAELHRHGGLTDDDERAAAIGRVEQESMRMGALVEDLLLLARLDEGRPLASDQVDLARVVEHVRSDTAVAHPDHPLETSVSSGCEVSGDGHRLHQVVANVVGNAIRHTPPGTTVRIEAAPVVVADGEAPAVEVVVSDDGPGIEPDLAARAFERFARGDVARSRAEGSTGLGLSIVQAIVTAHGGRVALTSALGEGTTVSIRLPVNGGRTPSDR